MPRSALFVIDIQHELARDPQTRVPHHERITIASTQILATARRIIDAYRAPPAAAAASSSSPQLESAARQSPSIIVFVQHDEPAEQGTLVKGEQAWQLTFPPREDVQQEILVAKTTRDTFESNPALAAQLKSQDITEITTFGLQSEYCVRSTSLGALDAGFKVTLLQGAHSTYDSEASNGGKTAVEIEREVEEELRLAGVEVVPWEDAVALWEQRGMISSYSVFSELV